MISDNKLVELIPWDSECFGMPCYELKDYSPELLDLIRYCPGHYSIKINPLESKKILQEYGFYYCDSLIEVSVNEDSFISYRKPVNLNLRLELVRDEKLFFKHTKYLFNFDRFHRDFNLSSADSDQRYDNWLSKIIKSGIIFACLVENENAGFIAIEKNRFLLHAIFRDYQSKGLSKFFWSLACKKIFEAGYCEIKSSISSTNLPVINLYSSLGFKFISAIDIYHLTINKAA